jgi:copper chaperone CopZ
MTHTYDITGMTCEACEAKVKSSFLKLPEITSVEVSREKNSVTLSMDKHVNLSTLQEALGGTASKYQINALHHSEANEQVKSWFGTYKPLIVLFLFIAGIVTIASYHNGTIHWMGWMNYFMAGFFLSFSFFKLLDLKGFAESYSMYDVVAKRIKAWGYIYPFIELGLGIAYATHFHPLITNSVTFIAMGISIIGVLQSVLNKRKIQCACLGAVFNLPMSTITILEDALMIVMSGTMIIYQLF